MASRARQFSLAFFWTSLPRPVLLGIAALSCVVTTSYAVLWMQNARTWSTQVEFGFNKSHDEPYDERTHSVLVADVAPGSPAEKAGLRAGDRIIGVNGESLTADKIFINVGARPTVPPILGLDQIPYLTNVSMMAVDFLPAHLVILGGSYVGLEFAQMYRRFGSAVTVIEAMPRLVAREDEDVSAEVARILEREEIALRLGAKALSVARRHNGIAVAIETSQGRAEIEGTHLLVAIGRRPNTDDLGLDKAGVALDSRGYIIVDDQLRTNVPGIWALGDCNGKGAFTHTSYNDYEIVAANLLDNDQRRLSDRIMAYALYIDPPLGRAGLSQAEVRKRGRPALVANWPMERVSRAFERGETQGFMRILVDRETKQILGASLLGLSADEVIQDVLDLMYAKAPYTTLQRAMHIHPTVAEYLPTMLGSLTPLA